MLMYANVSCLVLTHVHCLFTCLRTIFDYFATSVYSGYGSVGMVCLMIPLVVQASNG